MKQKRILTWILVIVLAVSVLAGCGGSSGTKMADSAAVVNMSRSDSAAGAAEEPQEAVNADVEMEYAGTVSYTPPKYQEEGEAAEATLPDDRKWIVTVHMSAETEDLDALLAGLTEQISQMNGYVEDQNVYNGSAYSGRRYRSASMTIRVPASDVDGFTQAVTGLANVVSQEKNLEDVTLSYSETENRVESLQTEQERLMELLAQADTLEEILQIEDRLTEVRYELENYGSRLRLYDNQINYATIYLNIEEVQEYTPVEEPSLWQRITTGFGDSLKQLGQSLQDLLVWCVEVLPFLVVYGGIALALILIIRRFRKKRKAKKTGQAEKPEKPEDQEKK